MVPASPSAVASRRSSLVDPACAEGLDVVADEAARLRASFDEHHARRAARQRLEAERAGAGEQVEDAQAIEVRAEPAGQDVEHRFADPSAVGRINVIGRREQLLAAKLAGDDAHRAGSGLGRTRPAGRSPAGPEPRGRLANGLSPAGRGPRATRASHASRARPARLVAEAALRDACAVGAIAVGASAVRAIGGRAHRHASGGHRNPPWACPSSS